MTPVPSRDERGETIDRPLKSEVVVVMELLRGVSKRQTGAPEEAD